MADDVKLEADIGELRKIDPQPLYTPADLDGWDYERDTGYPGEFPFTRGVQATMYRGRLWTMRQYAGMGDAEESNKRYKYLLAHGTTGLSVAFDLPTQIGMDSDHPMAAGEVGKVGVAIDSIEDMERLFAGINLEKISTKSTERIQHRRKLFLGGIADFGMEAERVFRTQVALDGRDMVRDITFLIFGVS